MTAQIFTNDVYFQTGNPYIDVKAYGAIGDNITDDSDAIQAALNAAKNGYKSVYLSPGTYSIPKGLILPMGVKFYGSGQVGSVLNTNADVVAITFEVTLGGYSELSSMSINGYQNSSAVNDVIEMPFMYGAHTGHMLKNIIISGGFRCLYTYGVDCVFENVFARDCFGPCLWASQGSNWYIRCKFDSERSITYCFAQASYPYPPGASSSTMNSFIQCDFTGNYSQNINFNDSMGGLMVMSQCNGLNVVNIINCGWISFNQCQFGMSIINNSAGVIVVSDSLALHNIVIAGNKKISNSINIS